VVDPHSRRVLTFKEAIRRKLVDPITGDYHDRPRGRLVYSSDAIRQGLIKTKVLNQFHGNTAAWLVPTGRPVLPVELGTMARVEVKDDLPVLPGELSSWPGTPGDTPSSPNVRRTISGWLLDL